ncbi:MAG: hypothetical protein Q7S02_02385 [bacterium]|nr:hypothetical protein [bacterium]
MERPFVHVHLATAVVLIIAMLAALPADGKKRKKPQPPPEDPPATEESMEVTWEQCAKAMADMCDPDLPLCIMFTETYEEICAEFVTGIRQQEAATREAETKRFPEPPLEQLPAPDPPQPSGVLGPGMTLVPDASVGATDEGRVPLEPAPIPLFSEPPPPETTSALTVTGWIGVGVAAVVGAFGVWQGVDALSEQASLGFTRTQIDAFAARDRAEASGEHANILFAVSGSIGLTAALTLSIDALTD